MLRRIAYLFLLLGTGLLIYGILTGEVGFALLLIFPVFYGSGIVSALSFIFLFLGFILFFLEPFLPFSSYHSGDFKSPPVVYPAEENISKEQMKSKTEKKYGGMVLIGPIPIVFGSDRDTVLVVVLIALIILAFLVFFLALPFTHG